MKDLATIIEEQRESIIDAITRWIKIPSVKSAATDNAPFGEEVRKALETALTDAETMGFTVRNFDNYVGDVSMGPTGVDPFAILAHLDVVPVGDGWTVDPFGAEIQGDKIYGRGTSDDKGPAIAALFAMKAVADAGIPLRREVRLILGCDEESGWDCMKHYKEHCDMPKTGFSPDASFPIINTEKGMLGLNLTAPYCNEGLCIEKINVGERPNVIPGIATALIKGDDALIEKANALASDMCVDVKCEKVEDGMFEMVSTGIPGHSAYPEHAKNAIGQLLLMLRALGAKGAIKTMANCVGMEYNGAGLGVQCSDHTSGPLTCNLGILRYDAQNGLFANLDIRYPILINQDALEKTIVAALGTDITVKVRSSKKPHHVAPNSTLVTMLLDAYHEVTDRPRECIATGGGTYARCLEEGVAFGSAFPEDEELAHQAGEYLSIEGIMTNVRIFARAIEKLCGVKS